MTRHFLAFVFLILASGAVAQSVQLSGTIRERGTGESIPGATLHILGTSNGARSNADGRYRVAIDRGFSSKIRITAIGYKPDTLSIRLSSDSSLDISLQIAPILGKTITVSADASRKEAERIMHKVIDSKDAWQSQISNYAFQVYSRGTLRIQKDTNAKVAAVIESIANGYWRQDKGYAERIIARKQTADVPADVNRFALLGVQNFYNERMDVFDYTVVSPVAHDAFDRYDYDLLGEGEINGNPVWKISVEPRGAVFPAFQGALWIDQTDYTIAYLDLQPNGAIKLGPVKNLDIQQTFSFVDNKFWLPSALTFDCQIKLGLPIVPDFRISQTATLDDYVVNGTIPDSIFAGPKHSVASRADSVDSLHWISMRTIPLSRDEDTAYHKFDSLAKISHKENETEFSPLGLLLELIPGTDFFQYNRVDGPKFELGHFWTVIPSRPLTFGGDAVYDIGSKNFEYSVDIHQALTTRKKPSQVTASLSLNGDFSMQNQSDAVDVTSSLRAQVYHEHVSLGSAYDPLVNTLTSLFLHEDYFNYYEARGFDIQYSFTPNRSFSATLDFKNEIDNSISNVTNYSLLFQNDTFRSNPPINDGMVHEIALNLSEDVPLGYWAASFSAQGLYSAPSIGSDFNYTTAQLHFSLEGRTGGWGNTWLAGTYSALVNGALPAQDLFFFEARDAVIAPRDVFHTMYPFEFQGDRTWQIMFEQNFYDLPTRALGITMPIDVQWFGFAHVAGATSSSATNAIQPIPIETIGSTPFVEAGFGIGNIFHLLRLDASWRLTHQVEHNFFVTGTLAISF
jgi:hypothetical protein